MADSPFIVTLTAQNFESVVVEGSFERPVLVDFWADWCAPCRSLMPVLAKLADAYVGKFILAKLNTEEERELAAQFGIRSLPTVQLFKDGRPVDQFMGALPEAQVREFLDRHIPRAADRLLAQARGMITAGDFDGARAAIEQARIEDPSAGRLLITEAQLSAAQGQIAEAQAALDRLPLELNQDPEACALRGQLRFAAALEGAPNAAALEARLESDPKDSEARYQLAAHRVAAGQFEAALDLLLGLVARDRAYGEDAGRKGMVAIFDLLGGDSELVGRYRARMMNALY